MEIKIPNNVKPVYRIGSELLLFQNDCLEILPCLPENSIDMIYSDPPYLLSSGGTTCQSGKMVSVNKGKWDKPSTFEENHNFNLNWLSECQRVLKKDATIWVSGTSHNIFSVGYAMQSLGFRILNDIVWKKTNPPPNLGCRCFTHSSEWILWASKSKKSKHIFHYSEMKKEAGGKQMKNIWEFQSPSKKEKEQGKHPTQKPISLIDRIIRASTIEGDIVLDPFNGSGTTGIASYRLKRKYIGIEQNKEFIGLSEKRLDVEK